MSDEGPSEGSNEGIELVESRPFILRAFSDPILSADFSNP
jgi:hypothetical protein